MTIEEFKEKMQRTAAVVKLTCGVGNNAAWLACLDAYDRLRLHRSWRTHTRGGHTVGYMYDRAIKAFHQYERRLIYADQNRFFHVADMPESTRRSYAEHMSDREYYDFWATIGGTAYEKTRPMVTSLQNKYRLSLEAHSIMQADILAWGMAAMACLSTACEIYDRAIAIAADDMKGVRGAEKVMRSVFGSFSLNGVSKLWRDALDATDPAAAAYSLNDTEARNISLGLDQLAEEWVSLRTLYGSVADTIADYGEVFHTRGFQKKALTEAADARNEAERILEGEA